MTSIYSSSSKRTNATSKTADDTSAAKRPANAPGVVLSHCCGGPPSPRVPGQPLYLEGINHCPQCNPKHLVDASRCQHDLRISRLSGRPLRRQIGESIENYTRRANDVFKCCPMERQWFVATTDYFKMDFLHSWLEGLRSKYLSSIVLTDAEGCPTVEKAVDGLRRIAAQEQAIKGLEAGTFFGGVPPELECFVEERGGGGGGGRVRGRRRTVNLDSQFVRIARANPDDHDDDDLDADGKLVWSIV